MKQVPPAIKQIIINMIHNYEQNDVINKYTGINFEAIEKIRREIKPKQNKKDSIFKKIYQNKTKFLEFKKQIPWSFYETQHIISKTTMGTRANRRQPGIPSLLISRNH